MTISVVTMLIQGDSVWISKRTGTRTFSGFYQFAGGSVEKNESLIEALKRETLEETGLNISPIAFQFVGANSVGSHIAYIYKVLINDGEKPKHTEPELMTEWELIPLIELRNKKLIPGVIDLLNRTVLKDASI